MTGKTIEEIELGDLYEESIVIKEGDVHAYAEITGDRNPLHEDEEYAAQTIFKRRIAHGMLLGGYISKVLGMNFPGGGVYTISSGIYIP